MHVCHFCDTSVEGDYFRNIAAGLARKGVRVSLIELGKGREPAWLGDIPSAAYHSLGATRKWQYPNAVRTLARFLKNESVDILHTHLFFAGLIGVLTKKLHRETVVALMRHHTGVVRMLGSRVHIAADKWMAENADRVLTVSHAARSYMLEKDGIRRDDIEVAYLGFDFERLKPDAGERARIRDEFGIGSEDLVIGYVGTLAKGKGHLQLVEAFEKTLAEIPNARLFFVGRGMLPEVRKLSARFPKDKIIFALWRDDVAACLNAFDLFVQPSLSEAFSQVLIEAMGVGLAVIATEVGGANEVIENGVNGILIAPNDPDAICQAVVQLFNDDVLRKRIALAGMTSVRERFTADAMARRHFELYEGWLSKK